MLVQSKWRIVIFDLFSIFNGGRIILNNSIYLLLVSVGSHSNNAKKKNIIKSAYNLNNAILKVYPQVFDIGVEYLIGFCLSSNYYFRKVCKQVM